jgi:hypothetical protein
LEEQLANRPDFTKLVGERLRITKGDLVREGLFIGRADSHFPDKPEWAGSWILYDDTRTGGEADISIRERDGWTIEVIDAPFDEV